MLILSRKINESIVIQDDIIITVLAVEGERVKLGIAAPREVRVMRMELWKAIQEQNQIAESLAADQESKGFDDLRAFLSSQDEEEKE
jgi:carbon storage regulator